MRSEILLYRSKNHTVMIDDASFVMLNDFTLSSVSSIFFFACQIFSI